MSGRLRSTGSPPVSTTNATVYPLNGWIRNTGNFEGEFMLVYRPYGMGWTSGSVSWRNPLGLDETSHVQINPGGRVQAVTGTYPQLGHIVATGLLQAKGQAEFDLGKLIALGTDVDGHPDEMAVIAHGHSPGGTLECGINWVELV